MQAPLASGPVTAHAKRWGTGAARCARDTSAAAIAAASLLKLAALGDASYRAAAERIVDALAEHHLARDGGLREGCYDQHHNLATASELIWGDYFLLEALPALDGVINSSTL